MLSKSPLTFNVLSNLNSPLQPSHSNFLSTPPPSSSSSSSSNVSINSPSPSQSPSSINSTSPPNGNQFVEHPIGEHPSRTLFVRNINSNVDEADLRALFEVPLLPSSIYASLPFLSPFSFPFPLSNLLLASPSPSLLLFFSFVPIAPLVFLVDSP